MTIKEKLQRTIRRSEIAYNAYKDQQLYYQALRIYQANKQLYNFLEAYLLECEVSDQDDVCEYLFHLEDWMNQFREHEEKNKNYTSVFVFERWKGAIPFPKEFVEKLKK
ncbi:hypothetical protein [Mesonia sp. K7]|uniref:hypothetical protein n=1 Tax=Mesonia sp. K7 TaxID=2218606 RepID=UPI000DA8A0B7|nr:hypothetical protein [Mesonia sp. K7]PZD76620.1 hypothetical protein DNG35_11560 [Mesonia sp. K7]